MLDNPDGAASVQLTFSYLNGSNNWFWAVDNIQLGTGVVPEPSSLGLILMSLMGLGIFRRR
ncbi:MAG: PEP-CTERM sorting domain-containing protein [Planctomycetota bacterium]